MADEPEQVGDPDVTGVGVLVATSAYVLLNLSTTLVAYFRWSLRRGRTNAFDNVVRLRPKRPVAAQRPDSSRQLASEDMLHMLAPQHFCSFLAQFLWLLFCRVLLSTTVFMFTVELLDKAGMAQNPMRHAQLAVALAATGATLREHLLTMPSANSYEAGSAEGLLMAPIRPQTILAWDDDPLTQAEYWARLGVIVLTVGYAYVFSAVIEEALSSFFLRLVIMLFSILLWSCQLVVFYPLIFGALVFLADPIIVIMNYAILLAAFGTIGGMLFGFDISSMSAWIGSDQYLSYFGHPGSTEQGGITASMSAGSFIGALVAGFLADHLGRRGALKVASVVWVAGAVLQCSAQNVAHLIIGRIVSGLSIGVTSSQVLVYLAELAPSHIRGRVVGIQQWAIEWGILIMYLISYGCSVTVDTPAAFRIAWSVQGIPGFILFAALFFPESPRWLASKDRWEEAHGILANLHAGGDLGDPVVVAELEEVREAVRLAAESKDIGYLGLFAPGVWKRTLVGVSVQVWQQLLGGNVMLYYLVYIFNMAGLVRTMSESFASKRMAADKIFRSREMSLSHRNDILTWSISGSPAKAVIALAYIFVGVYGLTWAPVAWIYCSEVFPLRYRAKGVGLAAAGNWIFNLALAFFVPPAFTNIQWKAYMIVGTFCFAMTVHAFLTYPETARKSLEEIDELFEHNVAAWRTTHAGKTFEDKVDEVRRTGGISERKAETEAMQEEHV
ncbi:sugar transporter [Purpureocillium lavendulum]|uniref:Sugar transporter n=1 Tax=Purpureocillium lavendulum TaxID=1247861 RepID=A0AB34FPS0_9HYPO|nr:sugar transporter [Purpureocillium lavendulum]